MSKKFLVGPIEYDGVVLDPKKKTLTRYSGFVKEKKMVEELKPAHYHALAQVKGEDFRNIDGRLMRVLTRLGYAVATKTAWKLTPKGQKAVK